MLRVVQTEYLHLVIVISALGMEGAVRVYAWQKAGTRTSWNWS